MKRRFRVWGNFTIDIEFEEDLLPDDEWRSVFYPIHTLEDVAIHMAWNLGFNHARLSMLDGWADRPDSDAQVIRDLDVEWDEVKELTS